MLLGRCRWWGWGPEERKRGGVEWTLNKSDHSPTPILLPLPPSRAARRHQGTFWSDPRSCEPSLCLFVFFWYSRRVFLISWMIYLVIGIANVWAPCNSVMIIRWFSILVWGSRFCYPSSCSWFSSINAFILLASVSFPSFLMILF